MTSQQAVPLRVILFGTTGMVGQGALRECLLDARVESVLSVGRRALGVTHPKLRELVVPQLPDLSAVEQELRGYDACFFCLGVTSLGKSEAEYRKLTFDLTLTVARTLIAQNPAMTFIYVSGTGTDTTASGGTMWARVKGETENALLAMPFKAAYMFRPGYIQPLHDNTSRAAWIRGLYAVLGVLYPLVSRLSPGFVTTTENIGHAMIEASAHGAPVKWLESRDINALAERP